MLVLPRRSSSNGVWDRLPRPVHVLRGLANQQHTPADAIASLLRPST